LVGKRDDHRVAKSGTQADAEHGAEEGGHDRFPADHPPHLPTTHADRPQQTDLARALEGGEGQGIGDTDHRYHHGQSEKSREQGQHLIDLPDRHLGQFGGCVDRDAGEVGQGRFRRRLAFLQSHPGSQCHECHRGLRTREVLVVGGNADDVGADAVVVDGTDDGQRPRALREVHRVDGAGVHSRQSHDLSAHLGLAPVDGRDALDLGKGGDIVERRGRHA